MTMRSNALALASAALMLAMASSLASADDPAKAAASAKNEGPGAVAAQSKIPTLDDASRSALLKAIEREREGIQLYAAVVAKHGSIRPFAPILEAEKRHEQELLNVAQRFALEVPPSTASTPGIPDTVKAGCEAAAKWERDTTALFRQISADVKRPGIKNTITRQASMATERHLPAFERCVKTGGALPQNAEAVSRCESCGMVNCPCSYAAGSAAASSGTGDKTASGAPPPACGCTAKTK